jgi:hypothetical protein
MVTVTMILGAVLVLLGLIGYLASGRASATALIPAFFGLPILVLGALARTSAAAPGLLWAAAALALLGFLGSVRGLAKLPALLRGEAVQRPAAVRAQSVMAVLSLAYVVLWVAVAARS